MTLAVVICGLLFLALFYPYTFLSAISLFVFMAYAYLSRTNCIQCNSLVIKDPLFSCYRCGHDFCEFCAFFFIAYAYLRRTNCIQCNSLIIKISFILMLSVWTLLLRVLCFLLSLLGL